MATNPWDKLDRESDESYARFLRYRNLGPCRTALKAYYRYLKEFDGYRGGIKGLSVPRTWRDECRLNFWVDRSAAWDVRCLQSYGARIATLQAIAIRLLARKNVKWVREIEPADERFADVMASVRTVGAFLTPELVKGVQERHQPTRRAATTAPENDDIG